VRHHQRTVERDCPKGGSPPGPVHVNDIGGAENIGGNLFMEPGAERACRLGPSRLAHDRNLVAEMDKSLGQMPAE
jgi:hypothetical protein